MTDWTREELDGYALYYRRKDDLPLVEFEIFTIEAMVITCDPEGPLETLDAEGHIKFDGCINWNTAEGFMLHFCEPADADAFRALFDRIWQLPELVLGETACFKIEDGRKIAR